jgi:hypothetical protein
LPCPQSRGARVLTAAAVAAAVVVGGDADDAAVGAVAESKENTIFFND